MACFKRGSDGVSRGVGRVRGKEVVGFSFPRERWEGLMSWGLKRLGWVC